MAGFGGCRPRHASPRSTVTSRFDFEDSKTSVLPLQDAVKGRAQVWPLAGDELLVGAVRDEHFRMIGAESLPQLVFQGIALDDCPLVGDVLRFHAAGLLKPQFVRRFESVKTEDRAHVASADALLAAFQPCGLALSPRELLEPFQLVAFRVLEWNTFHSFAAFISWTSASKN